mmetsp:Transcript_31173/g.56462  ORF Transcript_31173/g.56462 Transcript_31173/m.56462 type:complete len:118 (+) Transcript_31173:1386-1739(+)
MTREPLTAQLVRDTKEDFDQIQYQLQQQSEQLQQVLADLQANNAAPVVARDGEAIPDDSSPTTNEAKQSTSHSGEEAMYYYRWRDNCGRRSCCLARCHSYAVQIDLCSRCLSTTSSE